MEYSLATPITIRDAADIQSRKHWSEILEPYDHQIRNLLTFCRRAPVALIADDVGLGKTISAGLILSELMARRKVRRALVLAPLILLPQWKEELRTKFQIESDSATGQRVELLARSNIPVAITTYDSARGRLQELKAGRFDMLILDEAHKLRNLYGGGKAPERAEQIAEALANREFRYVLMLTATPIQNRLWDLYSLVDCLTKAKGHRNPLGSPDEFVARFVADGKTSARQVVPGRKAELQRHVGEYMVRMRRADCRLAFPTRLVLTIPSPPTAAEQPLMGLVARLVKGRNALAQVSLAQAAFSSPQALAAQVRNMVAKGTIENDLRVLVESTVQSIALPGKLVRLRRLIEELRAKDPERWRVVVFTTRLETLEMIRATLVQDGIFVGTVHGGRAAANERSLRDFRADPPNVNVILSTDSGAEGINLQVANVVVNYDLPWNPMIVEQRIGRVQRLASSHKNVMVINLVTAGTIEERVVGRLIEKLELISSTIGDIESILESSRFGDEDGFDAQIRELVIRAFEGQDIEAALRKAQESIDEAKRTYAAEKEVVEETLGGLDAMHGAGPVLPKLTPVEPRMSVRDFTLEALTADGATVLPEHGPDLSGPSGRRLVQTGLLDGDATASDAQSNRPSQAPETSSLPAGERRFRVKQPGRTTELATFDPTDPDLRIAGDSPFSGATRVLYDRDQPAFERLVGHWSRRDSHALRDARAVTPEDCRDVIQEWLARNVDGATIRNVAIDQREDVFQGTVFVRAGASVAHDRYEKLVISKIEPPGRAPIDAELLATAPSLPGEVSIPSLIPAIEAALHSHVERDSDLASFCEFYDARRVEELTRAGSDVSRRAKVEEHFSPALTAEVVGASGALYSTARTTLTFNLGGEADYTASFLVIPRARAVLEAPPIERCAVTGRRVPASAIADCAASKKRVIRDLLQVSDASGALALPDHFETCPISGKRLLKSEFGTSDVSGKRVDRRLLVKSAVTDRWGLADELARCAFTGVQVLGDELEASQVSGKLGRADQSVRSAVSGKFGHRSEFLRCDVTGDWILPDEGTKSAVSNRVARNDLIVRSEKPPHRAGLPSEREHCAITGKTLLSDEVEISGVSGKKADRDLLLRSAESGRLALPNEIVTCAESGAQILPDEADTCAVTRNLVSKRLLKKSEMSGRLALKRLLVRCEDTGRHLLPSETATCDVSDRVVGTDQLERCMVTGKSVLKRLMVRDAIDNSWMLLDAAGRSELSGRRCHPDKLKTCTWTRRRLLPDEVATCAWTGLEVEKGLLEEGALRPLVEWTKAVPASSDEELAKTLRWMRTPPLDSARAAAARWNESGTVAAVRAELANFFGFNKRVAGFLATKKTDGPGLELLGKIVVGRLKDGQWSRIEAE